MKKQILSISLASLSALTLQAATYTVSNAQIGATSNAITTSDGTVPINDEAFATFGILAPGVDFGSITAVEQVFSAFTPFGNNELNFIDPASNAFLQFAGGSSPQGTSLDAATFENQQIIFIAGNADTFLNATELFVVSLNAVFESVAGPGTPTVSVDTTTIDEILFGSIGPDVAFSQNPTFASSAQPSFRMAVVIPEPSSALLFAGSLTLLGFRRRRA